jgi:PPOX class probable F420-dependent enzyme
VSDANTQPGAAAVPTTQMGHGVKQRDIIKMSEAEVDAFLHERRPMSLCTINHDGSIHAVAMWYGFLEGSVAFETKAKAQKVQNLRRNPTMTCLVEDGDYYEELRGVELVGTAEIVEDPERMWTLGVDLFERYYGTYSDELKPFVETMLNKRVVIKLHVTRVVTWDHRKLGLGSTRPAP